MGDPPRLLLGMTLTHVRRSLVAISLLTLLAGCVDFIDAVSGNGGGGGGASATGTGGTTSGPGGGGMASLGGAGGTTGSTSTGAGGTTGTTSTGAGGTTGSTSTASMSGSTSTGSTTTGTTSGGVMTDTCDVAGGLQPGAPWPMVSGCPTRRGLSAHTGSHTNHVQWSLSIPISTLDTAAITIDADGTLYVPTHSSIVAVRPDGTQKWSVPVPAYQPPAIGVDGTLYVSGSNHKLVALDPAGGSVIWSLSASNNQPPTIALADDGTVVESSGANVLAATSLGALAWSLPVSTGGVDSSPAIRPGGDIFVVTQTGLKAITPGGALAWNHAFAVNNGLATPTIAPDGTIYVGGGPAVSALDPAGVELWSTTPGSGPGIFSWIAIGPDGTLYAVDQYVHAAVYAISPMDGSVEWAFNVGDMGASAPVVAADGILYVSMNKLLYALRPNGTQLFAFNASSSSTRCGAPAIANGTTYVVCGNKLYALGP